jgi:hypothetical protein
VTSGHRKHGRMDVARLLLGDSAITKPTKQFYELLVN